MRDSDHTQSWTSKRSVFGFVSSGTCAFSSTAMPEIVAHPFDEISNMIKCNKE